MKPVLFFAGLLAAIGLSACEPRGSGTSSSAASSESASMSVSEDASEAASGDTSESASASEAPPEPEPITHIDFPHNDPGALQLSDKNKTTGSGYGDRANWAPDMCFPTQGEAYANSQVYRSGGGGFGPLSNGTNGPQCAAANYNYPWTDNFCESRSAGNIMCAAGQGHQGQDIRPATCHNNVHWAVAAEDGVVTQIGTYTVGITGKSPPYRIYRYLHLNHSKLKVKYGDHVVRGQKIGLISNNMGTTPTTIHLHFEIRIAQSETTQDGRTLAASTFVPPYTALVDAYQRKLAGDCPTVE